ncbi:S8 family serine peptidase [Lentimicrobium sp. S6]|uniref:S8 family serine peptidase n=1 Tax=Lentimicrobium sp. S6 TaxID=2735872 RepID=UPI001552DFD4|nr:S8 family serine peptidase [Lentimicrobium sp. S6]NPD46239.1 S8 family serine peptidase [Lentimicrobium sp. S6]
MKNIYLLVFIYLFTWTTSMAGIKPGVVTPHLIEHLNQKNNDDLVRINIRLKSQKNMLEDYASLKGMLPQDKRQAVVTDLKVFAHDAQADLLKYLNSKSSSDFKMIRKFWIANVLNVWASETLIESLSTRTDIARIDIDEERMLIDAIPSNPSPINPSVKGVDEITYNVTKVNADDVWAEGYTGQDVIVSVIDAGVNYNHLDLMDHMWISDEYPNHGYDFHNDDNDPMDGHGHGTHCAGTVAGDGTAGSQTGMAPDALIMGCKVLGDDGSGNESSVWAAIEFSVEQGAQVLSMSLGWQHSWNPDRVTWRQTLDNTLAAGVVASIAAGNEGGSTTNPDDVRTPGDCPPPWLNPDQTLIGGISSVVCVGATDNGDNIAYFSSRGPSTWETIDPFLDYPFNPELGLIRPDVSAPGVDIKSTDAFNTNGYTLMSGTSMATPGVAGVMALLLSKNPGLSPEEICMILETTSVDLGNDGKDNVFGAGRVDAFEAIENTSEQGPSYESHVIVDPNNNGEIEAGESILLSLTLFNGSDVGYTNVDVMVSCESAFITMGDDTENYGDFDTMESITIDEGFSFEVAENLPGMESLKFLITATDGIETWNSSFTVTSYGPKLAIGNLTIDDSEGNGNGRLDPGEYANLFIDIHNTGQVESALVDIAIDYTGSFLLFENISTSVESVASEDIAVAAFAISVSEQAPIGSFDSFIANLTSGAFEDSQEFSLSIGLILEDWESGDFSMFDWQFENSEWFITDAEQFEGNFSAQSAAIGHNSSSSFVLEYEAGSDASISFYKKVSSEGNYDFLRFYIDGQEQDAWSGEVEWSMSEYDVSEGVHTFEWTYSKDGSATGGSDAAWVDYIVFPPMALPSIEMENEAEICDDQTYTSNAIVSNEESILWSTSGDGSFDNVNNAQATYTLGNADMSSEYVELMLTAIGSNGEVFSKVELIVMSTEIMTPNVPLGNSVLCINPSDEVYYAEVSGNNALSWSLEPVEAGALEAMADSVIVNWADDFVGEAMLKVMSSNNCAESEYSEPLVIALNALPQFLAEDANEVCYGQEAIIAVDLEGMAPWTVFIEEHGEVIFETSSVELSFMAMEDSVMTVLWVKDANACVNNESKSMEVLVNELPMVDLGADSLVCMNHSVLLDAGTDGNVYSWSTGEATQTIMVDSMGMNASNEKTISVMVTNAFDCSSEDEVLVSFQDCSGIGELYVEGLSVYPNPSNGIFELSFESLKAQEIQLEVLSLNGQIVFQESLLLNQEVKKHMIDLSGQPAQAYLLVLKNSESQVVKRIILE